MDTKHKSKGKPLLTICTVNNFSWRYIYFLDYTFRKLSSDTNFKWLILNNTPNNEEGDKLDRLQNSRIIHKYTKNLKGSEGHGVGLNELIRHIDTEYGLIIDPDGAVLSKNWDKVCIDELNGQCIAIGAPYDPCTSISHSLERGWFRYQNFPVIVFIFLKSQPFIEMDIDMRAQSSFIRKKKWVLGKLLRKPLLDKDVGWRLPFILKKYGHTAKSFDFFKCHDKESIVLSPDARGDEFHWRGQPIFTHQGRSISREFFKKPVSKKWIEKVCSYLKIDMKFIKDLCEVE